MDKESHTELHALVITSSRWVTSQKNEVLIYTAEEVCSLALYIDTSANEDKYTAIPRLTKMIRSGITFVSRNVISRKFL